MAEKLIKKLNNREFYAKYSDYAAMDEDGERLSDRKVKSVTLDAASGTMTVTSTDGDQAIPVVPDAPHTQGLVLRTNADGTYAWGAAGAEPGRGRLLMRLGSAPEATDTGFNANSETDVTVDIPVASAVAGEETDGLMPSSDKSKLDGIETGTQANKIETVQLNGTTVTPTGTTVNIQVDKSSVGLGNVENTSDRDKPISTATQSALDGKADKATTLAGYGIADAYTKTETGTLLDGKVDKVYGKQLSTEDYTTEEKTKLSQVDMDSKQDALDGLPTMAANMYLQTDVNQNIVWGTLPAEKDEVAIYSYGSNASGIYSDYQQGKAIFCKYNSSKLIPLSGAGSNCYSFDGVINDDGGVSYSGPRFIHIELSGTSSWAMKVFKIPEPLSGYASRVLTVDSNGAPQWVAPATMSGATPQSAGASGLVPAPAAGDDGKFLKGDGTWASVLGLATSVTYDENNEKLSIVIS